MSEQEKIQQRNYDCLNADVSLSTLYEAILGTSGSVTVSKLD